MLKFQMILKRRKQSIITAAAIVMVLAAGILLFYKHWQFELPGYPNVDEQLSLGCIYNLMNQHLYAGDIYVLDFFRYPHLTFYYAVTGVRVLGRLLSGVDTTILLRYLICGTALVSDVCVYFAVRIMTGSRRWGFASFLLAVFSLYGYSYLYYTGPDTMIYAVANVILLLGCLIYKDVREDRVVYLWYPLLAVCIGLAMAAKYHGILFGIFWLALHIRKKYWRSYRDNFLFFLNCIVLALVFCVCNYSLFFHFKTFIGDNLYNLNHYAWGHPGIEHNLPLLGYVEAYAFTGYGAVGAALLILGLVYLIRKKDWQQAAVFLLMPVFLILFLSKYQIVLGRNVSLVLPYAYLFMAYGLMEAETLLKRCCFDKHKKRQAGCGRIFTAGTVIDIVVVFMILANVIAVCNHYRYDLTYTRAEAYITEQIPEGATIYCTSFAPAVDGGRYEVIDIGEDITQLPDQLGEGEYFIDVQYATAYFTQKKDYLIRQGGDMYPDLKQAWAAKLNTGYSVLQRYEGISYGGEWKYRVGYLDFMRYSPAEYCIGPCITIYGENDTR